eukprot:952844_1
MREEHNGHISGTSGALLLSLTCDNVSGGFYVSLYDRYDRFYLSAYSQQYRWFYNDNVGPFHTIYFATSIWILHLDFTSFGHRIIVQDLHIRIVELIVPVQICEFSIHIIVFCQ